MLDGVSILKTNFSFSTSDLKLLHALIEGEENSNRTNDTGCR